MPCRTSAQKARATANRDRVIGRYTEQFLFLALEKRGPLPEPEPGSISDDPELDRMVRELLKNPSWLRENWQWLTVSERRRVLNDLIARVDLVPVEPSMRRRVVDRVEVRLVD